MFCELGHPCCIGTYVHLNLRDRRRAFKTNKFLLTVILIPPSHLPKAVTNATCLSLGGRRAQEQTEVILGRRKFPSHQHIYYEQTTPPASYFKLITLPHPVLERKVIYRREETKYSSLLNIRKDRNLR
jgi:hypothetical protein